MTPFFFDAAASIPENFFRLAEKDGINLAKEASEAEIVKDSGTLKNAEVTWYWFGRGMISWALTRRPIKRKSIRKRNFMVDIERYFRTIMMLMILSGSLNGSRKDAKNAKGE